MKKTGERHIRLYHWILRSRAWNAASPNAKAVLIDVWARHNGANNGQIVYSASEAERVGLSKATGARALRELVELGFLRITRESAFTLKTKEARQWALTMEPVNDHPPTKEFVRWHPKETSPATRPNLKHGLTSETHSLTHETEGEKPRRSNGSAETRNASSKISGGYGLETTKNTTTHGLTHETDGAVHGLTHETLIVYQGVTASEARAGSTAPARYAVNRLPVRFGDEAKARRTRRVH